MIKLRIAPDETVRSLWDDQIDKSIFEEENRRGARRPRPVAGGEKAQLTSMLKDLGYL